MRLDEIPYYYETDAYDALDRAISCLRYAFDGVDPEAVPQERLEMAAKYIEQALELLNLKG